MSIGVLICFDQSNGKKVSKVVGFQVVPPPGSLFEYEEGWSLHHVAAWGESGLHLEVTLRGVSIGGYGPQFMEDELRELVELGWEIS